MMNNEEIIEMLKELVNKTYDEDVFNWTYERSEGNYYDCFDDGFNCGQSVLAYQIGHILGMDLVEPEEIEE